MLPLTEAVGKLSDPRRRGRRREKVEQDLESLPGHTTQGGFEYLAAAHEEAAQRIGNISLANDAGEARRRPAYPHAAAVPSANPAARDIATADHQISRAAVEGFQHLRQQPLVMLQIGVHDGDIRRGASQHAFDAGSGKTAPADPLQTAHPGITPREVSDVLGRAVTRVVIDKDHLPFGIREGCRHQGQQWLDVLALVQCRDNDAQYGRDGSRGGALRFRVQKCQIIHPLLHDRPARQSDRPRSLICISGATRPRGTSSFMR